MDREEAKALHGKRCLIHLNLCVAHELCGKWGRMGPRAPLFWVLCDAEANGNSGASFWVQCDADMAVILLYLYVSMYIAICLKSIV